MFKKGDPKPAGSGRAPGVGNKDKPLKAALAALATKYATSPEAAALDANGDPLLDGDGNAVLVSKFEQDLWALNPADRARLMVKVFDFLIPKLQSITADVNDVSPSREIAEHIRKLSGEG